MFLCYIITKKHEFLSLRYTNGKAHPKAPKTAKISKQENYLDLKACVHTESLEASTGKDRILTYINMRLSV